MGRFSRLGFNGLTEGEASGNDAGVWGSRGTALGTVSNPLTLCGGKRRWVRLCRCCPAGTRSRPPLSAAPRRGSPARPPCLVGQDVCAPHARSRPWSTPRPPRPAGFAKCTVSCVHHDHVLHRCRCPKPPVLPPLGVPATLTLPCRRSSPCSGTPWIWVHTACGLSGSASLTYSLLCSFWRRRVPGVWPLPLVTVTAGSAASAVSLALTLPPPPYEDAGPLGTQVVPTCRCLT